MGYLIKKPAAQQIVTAKVTLTSADLLTPGYIYSIPEFPAVADYFWNTQTVIGEIVPDIGSLSYVGTSNIHLQCSTGTAPLFRFGNLFMSEPKTTFAHAIISLPKDIQYAVNDSLEIHNPGTLTVGNTGLIIYVSAILTKY